MNKIVDIKDTAGRYIKRISWPRSSKLYVKRVEGNTMFGNLYKNGHTVIEHEYSARFFNGETYYWIFVEGKGVYTFGGGDE